MAKATLAVIIGNRDFFPDQLVTEARNDIQKLFQEMDLEAVMLDPTQGKNGSIETWAHAKEAADLFRKNRDRIDGILVVLPNFGDEKGVADTIRLSGLNVPILIQAYPDDVEQFNVERRRDAFCGKVSVCNNLRQYGYAFSLTSLHTVHPLTDSFRKDLAKFVAVCRTVNGLRNARLGAIGARPGNFNTVRFSEKILQAAGISVVTVDLSDILGNVNRLPEGDARVTEKLDTIKAYARWEGVPSASLVRMAKLGVVIEEWMAHYDLTASAIQCWNSVQQNFGVNVCTLMSMMSNQLMPSACEVDVTGVVSMYALQLASQTPSALVDWNNNYADDPNKCVLFHCGNWAKSFLPDIKIAPAEILATTLGTENTYGAVAGRVPPGPLTFARVSTDDVNGLIRTYVGEGRFTDDELKTFGARAVVEIPNLQALMQHICLNGYEHHAAMSASHVAGAVAEAFGRYLNWDVYHHSCA